MLPKKNPPDFILFITVLILLGIGIVMVFSASQYVTIVRFQNPFFFVEKQLLWALIGIVAMIVMMNFDYFKLKRFAGVIVILAFILLILVLIPGIGKEVNGARRWIDLGFVSFAPAELVKTGLIIFMAYKLSKMQNSIRRFSSLLPYIIVMGLAAGLIILQPNLGTTIILCGTIMCVFLAAGARILHLSALCGLGILAVAAAIYFEPYRLKRFLAFLNPEADPQGAGYQIIQSLYALGSGGLFGVGLGQSKQKFLYLPENHTDFIFAIIGEELGFAGASLIILLFMLFAWRGFKIAITSPDAFASLLAAGITCGIVLEAIINIGVVAGSMPVTGTPLPFISFGGSSLLFTLIGVGILLNISRYAVQK